MLFIFNFVCIVFVCIVVVLFGGCVIVGDVCFYLVMVLIQLIMLLQVVFIVGVIYVVGLILQLYLDCCVCDVGDLLMIILLENIIVQISVNMVINKEFNLSLGMLFIFGVLVILGGKDIFSVIVKGVCDFIGKGNSVQSNCLQGSVMVMVIQCLFNGNLVVQGQKNLWLNQGDELVQVQGIVCLGDISQDNIIFFSCVVEVCIVYGGRGLVVQFNVMGWLSCFFNFGLMLF